MKIRKVSLSGQDIARWSRLARLVTSARPQLTQTPIVYDKVDINDLDLQAALEERLMARHDLNDTIPPLLTFPIPPSHRLVHNWPTWKQEVVEALESFGVAWLSL